ncbi:hypothetical protein A2673_04075 [Candidatus Kaiserbacteria bacterium RIFCSPHIGHO2_01_FULL_50_13]|uniref:Lipid II flippase MurJ n=1 Tax=Candidatus Kaiserbacteria bacterium RIFCSPLOWO2_01_FULL_50_24 TaxID=1798507 RepID=A0A1F6ENG6_9BACT|nr:MAG: hypothetical protein A2673_04075 [Candidatus Kaiserbacteria bacterium RIFCSPHIGHO2_01_FULL_50_13]OGG75150.1 MAG: hypothetical protein A3A34_02230 [Candidatus Kaiserbacteria bacterium RIFCSPLOWO2_01_FULL_50_24]OGG81071.1 MAG: hypothetical protein A3H74_04080 [Candidatus Kaiserbacteria bacterium RIFCSPLOWO2_02_FULL_51_13]
MIRALRLFSLEVQSMHVAAYILGASAILSSLLALLRDRLLAHTFGAGVELDVYYAAFRVPDIIFVALTALVSVYVLVPELSRRSESDQRAYIDTICVGFSVLAILVSLGAFFSAPKILLTFFPQLSAAGYADSLVALTRIMLLQPALLGFSNIFAAITQMKRRFMLYALTPILYNVGIIVGVLVLYPIIGLSGLAWGVVLGAALHALVQVPTVLKDGFFTFPAFATSAELWSTVRASLPRSLALAMSQFTFLGLTVIAGTLAVGSIASFMFAYNLYSVPLAIIGASYSVAAFPTLAAAFSRGKQNDFVENVALAARHIIFWSFPIIALMLVLRAHIVRAILGSGAFDWTDTRITAAALALFTIALTAQCMLLLLARAYYAAGRSFVPLVFWSAMAVCTIVLSYGLVYVLESPAILEFVERLLRVSELPGTQVLALAFASSLVAVIGALALAVDFELRFGGFLAQIRRTAGESLAAAFATGAVSYTALSVLGTLTSATTFLTVVVHAASSGAVGVLAAIAVYYVFQNREFLETMFAMHTRIRRTTSPALSVERIVGSAEE